MSILEAVASGSVNMARSMVQDGVEFKEARNGQYMPLQLAALLGDVRMCRMLVEHGADVHGRNPRTQTTALHCAAFANNVDVVAYLLNKGADPTAEDHNGMQPLHFAAYNDCARVVPLLADAAPQLGRQPGRSGVRECSPMHVAAAFGCSSAVSAMLASGLLVDAQDVEGQTPLHWAACSGDCPTVIVLLEADADKKARDDYGFMPVRVAELCGHFSVVRLLNMDDNFNPDHAYRSLVGGGKITEMCSEYLCMESVLVR